MPKSESPKLGKRRNWKFWWFGFQHVPIPDVWAYETCQFCPKTERVRFGLLSPNCTKSEQFSSDFRRIFVWFERYVPKQNVKSHLALRTFRFWTEIYVQKQNFFVRILDAVRIPNCLELGQKLNVWEMNMFRSRHSSVFFWISCHAFTTVLKPILHRSFCFKSKQTQFSFQEHVQQSADMDDGTIVTTISLNSGQTILMSNKTGNGNDVTRPHCCDVCQKTFAKREHLTKHLRIHKSDNKRYSCEYCHKAFRDRYELVRHTRRHTGDFPFR